MKKVKNKKHSNLYSALKKLKSLSNRYLCEIILIKEDITTYYDSLYNGKCVDTNDIYENLEELCIYREKLLITSKRIKDIKKRIHETQRDYEQGRLRKP